MTDELKLCPFCGGEPTEHAIEPHSHAMTFGDFKMPDHEGSHVIECVCGAGLIDDTREAVVARWNTRALTQRPAAQTEREALRWTVSVEPVAVSGEPDAHCLLASIGNQAFHIGPDYMDTKREAEFFAEMFLHAIEVGHRASLPIPQQATPEPVGDVRCEGCGYMTHHREHMGCVRAAKQHTRPAPGVPDVEAAAKKLAECMDYPWEHMHSAGRDNMRKHAEAVLAAAQAKGYAHD